MNDIITIGELANRLAKICSLTPEQAKEYIGLITQHVTRELSNGVEKVYVPYIGTFITKKGYDNIVDFEAVNDIAEVINEPFSFFEPVKLYKDVNDLSPDTVTTTDSDTITTPADTDNDVAEVTKALQEMTKEKTNDNTESEIAEHIASNDICTITPVTDQNNNNPTTKEEPKINDVEKPDYDKTITADVDITENTQEYVDEQEQVNGGLNPIVSYILGILTGMVLMCVAVYFLYPPLHPYDDDDYCIEEMTDEDSPSASEVIPVEDSNNNVGKTPDSDSATTQSTVSEKITDQPKGIAVKTADDAIIRNTEVKTDTVGPKYYLATMSRKYYGRMEFWVYIYKENQNKLGHPDRIPVGTVVNIPPASKYDINPNSQASIDQARKLAQEILTMYK